MRIARIRHLFFPDTPKDYFYELTAKQVKIGHQVDVLTWSQIGESRVRKVAEGFNIYSMHGLNFAIPGLFEHYPFLPELPDVLERVKPEIVHAESHLFLTTAQAVTKAKKLDLPSVVSVHGVFAKRGLLTNFFQDAYIRTVGLDILRKTDIVICLTKSDVAEIIHFGVPSEKIRLVSNAVDTEIFKPAANLPSEAMLIVWVGRFVNEKGVEYFIRAAKLIAEKSKDVRFLLIGYGPLKFRMMQLAANIGISSSIITFSKPMKRKDVAKILSTSSIFVFPSIKEGMPLALLEAMASGNAIVASDIPGVNEVIKNNYNGLLVLPRDPEAIASAVLTLINDTKLKKKLSFNARKTVENNFSFNNMLTNLEAVYLEAMRRHK